MSRVEGFSGYERRETFRENFSIAMGAHPAVVNIHTYYVPARCKMKIKEFANYLFVVANWGLVRWDVLVNGKEWPSYTDIRDLIGYSAQSQASQEEEISGGSYVQFIATTLVGAVASDVGIRVVWELISQVD